MIVSKIGLIVTFINAAMSSESGFDNSDIGWKQELSSSKQVMKIREKIKNLAKGPFLIDIWEKQVSIIQRNEEKSEM